LPLSQQQALQKNQISVLEVLQLGNLAVERKYREAYLEHGFTYSTIDGEQRSQCLIYSKILANESMKPVKLKRHMATKQAEFKNKPIDFLRGN
jgi:hypothetical protein